jgi:hypothetical protein
MKSSSGRDAGFGGALPNFKIDLKNTIFPELNSGYERSGTF